MDSIATARGHWALSSRKLASAFRSSGKVGWMWPNAARFSITGRPAKIVGRTPRSAAGPLAGLPVVDETDPVGEERVQGTRADQGVRPTIFAEFSELEKRVALGGCQPPPMDTRVHGVFP